MLNTGNSQNKTGSTNNHGDKDYDGLDNGTGGTMLTGEIEREQQRWRQDSNKHDDKAEETEPKDQMTKPRPETKNIRQSRKTTKRARTKNIH